MLHRVDLFITHYNRKDIVTSISMYQYVVRKTKQINEGLLLSKKVILKECWPLIDEEIRQGRFELV